MVTHLKKVFAIKFCNQYCLERFGIKLLRGKMLATKRWDSKTDRSKLLVYFLRTCLKHDFKGGMPIGLSSLRGRLLTRKGLWRSDEKINMKHGSTSL